MEDMLLLKLGEIVLKGLNRKQFEMKLMGNVTRRLRRFGKCKCYCIQSTLYVEPQEDGFDMDGAMEAVRYIFGIASISRAIACEKDKDAMVEAAKNYLGDALSRAASFKVESRRSDKRFPMTSIEISQYVGGELSEAYPQVPVDVHNPDLTIHVEVRDLAAYVHGPAIPGAGGLPVGSNGRAISLLSGGIDSPVSTYMIAKRGISIYPVHFFSFPYTSELAKQKVLELGGLLTKYCGRMSVIVVPFTHIQEEIREKCPEEYFTLIMRRFMMRIAQQLADMHDAHALVTGENLGQVASQTMEAMAVTQAPIRLPVLQPLMGMDKEEIVTIARRIGTFETSILPYEDCCTVFTPRHPKTRPTLQEIEEAEQVLEVDALVTEAVAGIERIKVGE
ncbi:MAG: tRNA 4-thiouridine(8) synthase ThiI [Oscillospiraceae bacterium]|nr:tRNA 4-thiouridine(8) synthase ThiI [Oscillospiraceae bacterium]